MSRCGASLSSTRSPDCHRDRQPVYQGEGEILSGETEHFGFRDGISQPGVRGRTHPGRHRAFDHDALWRAVAAGYRFRQDRPAAGVAGTVPDRAAGVTGRSSLAAAGVDQWFVPGLSSSDAGCAGVLPRHGRNGDRGERRQWPADLRKPSPHADRRPFSVGRVADAPRTGAGPGGWT